MSLRHLVNSSTLNIPNTVTMVIPAPDPSGIEETIAAGKAAKILRDGQILIRKADKTYNVMGATIR